MSCSTVLQYSTRKLENHYGKLVSEMNQLHVHTYVHTNKDTKQHWFLFRFTCFYIQTNGASTASLLLMIKRQREKVLNYHIEGSLFYACPLDNVRNL